MKTSVDLIGAITADVAEDCRIEVDPDTHHAVRVPIPKPFVPGAFAFIHHAAVLRPEGSA